MSGIALDEISSNLQYFFSIYIHFKKFLGSKTRIFGIFSSGSPEHANDEDPGFSYFPLLGILEGRGTVCLARMFAVACVLGIETNQSPRVALRNL